jgi:hypothetical protein
MTCTWSGQHDGETFRELAGDLVPADVRFRMTVDQQQWRSVPADQRVDHRSVREFAVDHHAARADEGLPETGKHHPVRRYRCGRQRIVGSVIECRKSTVGIFGSRRAPRDDGCAKQPSEQEPPTHARRVTFDSIHFIHDSDPHVGVIRQIGMPMALS